MTDTRAKVKMYRRRRRALIAKLGGHCAICGSGRKIEFDHPNGRDYDLAKMARWTRIKQYEEEAEKGLIRLLCRYCNAGYKPQDAEEDF